MAWNARAVVVAVVLVAGGGTAVGQVMQDDHRDTDAPLPIGAGVTQGRFDHRAPRAEDRDSFAFYGVPGRSYRVRLLVASPALDEDRASATSDWPLDGGGLAHVCFLQPLAVNDVVISGSEGGTLLQVEGLAQRDGSSVPYQLVVDDLGAPSVDTFTDPQHAPFVAVGEWFDGTFSRSVDWPTDGLQDLDFFSVQSLPGHHYAIEYQLLDGNGGNLHADFVGNADGSDYRFPAYSDPLKFPFSHSGEVDTVVPGRLVGMVHGYVRSADEAVHYRARVVDTGPAHLDDVPDWAQAAAPAELNTNVEFTLNDHPRTLGTTQVLDDVDCFSVELVAGRAYSISMAPAAGSLSARSGEVSLSRGSSGAPLLHRGNQIKEFKPVASGRYTLRCECYGVVARQVLRIDDRGPVQDDAPDSVDPSQPIFTGGVLSGVLENSNDRDVFALGVPAGQMVQATLVGDEPTDQPISLSVGFYSPSSGMWDMATLVQRWGYEGEDVFNSPTTLPAATEDTVAYLVVTSGSNAELPSHAYTFYVQITPVGGGAVDDWPNSVEGATHIQPGETPRVARNDGPGDVDVFTVDLIAGRLYHLQSAALVLPAEASLNSMALPVSHNATIQPLVSRRYQLVYSERMSHVGIEDRGPVADDSVPGTLRPKVTLGQTVHGSIDFFGDEDAWQVEAFDDGIYELEVTASPGTMVYYSTDNYPWYLEVRSSGEDGGQQTLTRRFAARRTFGTSAPLDISVVNAWGLGQSEYAVAVRRVDMLRRPAGADPTGLAIGQWTSVRPAVQWDQLNFQVPVSNGHAYRVETEGDPMWLSTPSVTNPEGMTPVQCDGVWRADSTGLALLTFRPGPSWLRVRVLDLGPVEDDHGETWDAATPLSFRQTVHGTFECEGDVDSFRLPLSRGGVYHAVLTLPPDTYRGSVMCSVLDPRGSWGGAYWNTPLSLENSFEFTYPSFFGGEPGLLSIGLRELPFGSVPLSYSLTVWPACAADIAGPGAEPTPDGALDNNDFIVFIDQFFDRSVLADIGRAGGEEGADDALDNNDFIVYISRFFAGCP